MRHSAPRPALLAAVVAAWLCVACAGMFDADPNGPGAVRTPTGQPVAPQAALGMIALGKSTKADVRGSLGEAIAIHFDSGREVWVYRWPGADKTPRGATELVVLFDGSGVATKARVRPGLASRD